MDRLEELRAKRAHAKVSWLAEPAIWSDIDYLLSLLDAPPIVDAEQVAREIVDNELDEMMSPREYSATRRALIDRIASAITAQRAAERQRIHKAVEAMRPTRAYDTCDKLLSAALDDVIEAIDGGR